MPKLSMHRRSWCLQLGSHRGGTNLLLCILSLASSYVPPW